MTRAGEVDTRRAIEIADLTTGADGEPRVQDIVLGEKLGFVRSRKVREIIERNLTELEAYGSSAPRQGAYRGTCFTEYYLNEPQALLICMFSNTSRAAEVRKMLIDVFMEYRRGKLGLIPVKAHSRRTSTRVDDAIRLKKNIDRLERATADIQAIADAKEPCYLSAMVIDGEPVVVDVTDYDIQIGERAVVIHWNGSLAVEAVSKSETGAKKFGERSAFGPRYIGHDGGSYRDGVAIVGKVVERRKPGGRAPALAPQKTRVRSAEIIPLLRAGMTPLQVVAKTGAHANTVYRWRKRLAG